MNHKRELPLCKNGGSSVKVYHAFLNQRLWTEFQDIEKFLDQKSEEI